MPKKVLKTPSSSLKLKSSQYLSTYEGIIKQHPADPMSFICQVCSTDKQETSCQWKGLEQHMNGKRHKDNVDNSNFTFHQKNSKEFEVEDSSGHIDSDFQFSLNTETGLNFRFAKFILENRLPLAIIDPLLSFIKELQKDFKPEIIRKSSLSRSILKIIIDDCIAKDLKEEITQKLRTRPFSIALDGSSDVFGKAFLGITAKYIEEDNSSYPITKLISVLPIEESSTGEEFYRKIKEGLLSDPLIERNFLGIATDEGSNMVSDTKGVSSRLLQDYPYILPIRDFSHIYNLIFKKAMKGFQRDILEIVPSISSHFGRSSQRRSKLYEIQKGNNQPTLGVLKYSDTRWLSYKESLSRILTTWDSLKEYFNLYGSHKQKGYFTDKNQLCLKVLLILSEKLNHYNIFFQKDSLLYNGIIDKIKEGYIIFAKMVFRTELISKNMDLGEFHELFELPLTP